MVFCSVPGMVFRMKMMRMCNMSMVCGFFMVSGFVMFGRFMMMFRRFFAVFGSVFVMVDVFL